ncbi:MAG: nucleotide exchange factor GrpE [candidate division Zixibacteria bacterium]|nr:nucleotide exchange factor GrpE [candidate division Zixibacteria bacterium]
MKDEKIQTNGNDAETTASDMADAPAESELTIEEQLSIQLAEKNDQFLRLAADYENYRKRMARQMEEVARSANDRILNDLFDVVDNFERALKTNGTDLESMRKGTEMIYQQVIRLLASYDIKPFDSLGEVFDPNKHEALMKTPSADYPEGCVAMEISKGFIQGERVVRHTRVAVSSGKPADTKASSPGSAESSN